MISQVENLRIHQLEPLISPQELKRQYPLPPASANTIASARRSIAAILARKDPRLLLVVGPCSIHNIEQAIDYAERLHRLREQLARQFFIVMRVYFEKPRTTTGWKGLINDPNLSGTFEVAKGLSAARQLLLKLAAMGIPTGTEALDPIVPQYIQELISWTAIGARTSESQTHREMASGLSTPVGFKNGTNGDLAVAINAMLSAASPHSFLGINQQGMASIVHTTGNPHAHIVLRGGGNQTNYRSDAIAKCEQALAKANLASAIMIDASHANSNKDPAQQSLVMEDICSQIAAGNRSIIGAMLESNLSWGNQPLGKQLTYGVSITDACIDWPTTEKLLRDCAAKLAPCLSARCN